MVALTCHGRKVKKKTAQKVVKKEGREIWFVSFCILSFSDVTRESGVKIKPVCSASRQKFLSSEDFVSYFKS
jgi:hypothetical protein